MRVAEIRSRTSAVWRANNITNTKKANGSSRSSILNIKDITYASITRNTYIRIEEPASQATATQLLPRGTKEMETAPKPRYKIDEYISTFFE